MSGTKDRRAPIWVWLAVPIFTLIVGYAFWVQPDDPFERPSGFEVRAKRDMAAIAEAVAAESAHPDVRPSDAFVQLVRAADVPAQDPWGNRYVVRDTETGFEVVSEGPPGGAEIVVRRKRP